MAITKTEKPTISVVVPGYNEEKCLPACLSALSQQDFPLPYEVVFVNNNSTDNSVSVAQKFPIRIVLEKTKGVIFAKQKGVLSAKADIVAVVDADTAPPPNWLSKIYKTLMLPGVVGVGGPYRIADGPEWHKQYVELGNQIFKLTSKITGHATYLVGHNLAFWKKYFLAEGGYNTKLGMGEDEYGVLDKLKKHGKVVFDPTLVNPSSGRRATRGILQYFIDVLFVYPYSYLTGKFFKRQFFTSAYDDIR